MDVQQEPRISQLLPAIKCSDCGETVEFRRLGEHICQAAPAVPALPSAFRKPAINPSSGTANLNPIFVSGDGGYDAGRLPYDNTPSPTDSGYSANSSGKYTSPPPSMGPTNFLQKYEKMTGKQIGSSTTRTSPIENDKEYYNNGFSAGPKRFDRLQDNFNTDNGGIYTATPNAYDNKPRDPYGQRKPLNNDRYNQQLPFDDNNNRYNIDDPYRIGKPKVPNDPYIQRPDDRFMRNQNPNDRYNNDYMRGPLPSNQPYSQDYDYSRQPTYNGQPPYNYNGSNMPPRNPSNGSQPPFSKPYTPPPSQKRYDQGNRIDASDPNEGRGFDDLMDDLMKEMDSMQAPSKYNGYEEPSRRINKNGGTRDICAYCKTEITSSSTTLWALGRTWHSNHLLCGHCRKPIDPSVGHVERDGNVYCPIDFTNLFLPKCRRCNKPVEKEAVSASDGKLEGKWHVKCFVCHTCNKPFPDKSFYVFDNAPYCKRHYHKLNNSLCKTCDDPIEGPCVQTVEGWRYHPSCFVCFNCQIPLTNIYYSFESKQYCETHIMEIKRSRKIRAEKRQTMFRNI